MILKSRMPEDAFYKNGSLYMSGMLTAAEAEEMASAYNGIAVCLLDRDYEKAYSELSRFKRVLVRFVK